MPLPDTCSHETEKLRWRDSLQGRLIASHVLVIVFALGLVVLTSSIFLFRYERTVEEERLAQLAVPLMAEVNIVRVGNQVPEVRTKLKIDVLDAQADAMELRILIVDTDGTVRYDTSEDDSLHKQSFPEYADIAADVVERSQGNRDLQYVFLRPSREEAFAGQQLLIAAGTTGIWDAKRALVIVSDSRRFPLLGLFLPRLVAVTGISLIIASLLGFLFSRRIARPVHRLTVAANAMSGGALAQEVPGSGPDEIGRLVSSFNSMSQQVSSTYQSQRDLLADVAHELRTPLTSVQGYAQALRDGVIVDEHQKQQALTIIGRESERMANLIVQLLDLARLESGQTNLTLNAVRVTGLIQRIEDRFRPEASAKQIAFTLSSPEDIAIRGDEGRLLQILSNLISNSIRHTPMGGLVSITACAVGVIPSGGPGVRLIVHDNGEGIPIDRLPQIFDRFERGGTASADGSQGFGLGLAIVRQLVDLHQGTISVNSEPGRGTTFTIDLPSFGVQSPTDRPVSRSSAAPASM